MPCLDGNARQRIDCCRPNGLRVSGSAYGCFHKGRLLSECRGDEGASEKKGVRHATARTAEGRFFCYLQGTIVNRTYGTHKSLYISLFLLSMLVLFTMPPRNSRYDTLCTVPLCP